ncbi:MAG: hypothetical protein AAF198_01545 [Pseudomonadota bacterium]
MDNENSILVQRRYFLLGGVSAVALVSGQARSDDGGLEILTVLTLDSITLLVFAGLKSEALRQAVQLMKRGINVPLIIGYTLVASQLLYAMANAHRRPTMDTVKKADKASSSSQRRAIWTSARNDAVAEMKKFDAAAAKAKEQGKKLKALRNEAEAKKLKTFVDGARYMINNPREGAVS